MVAKRAEAEANKTKQEQEDKIRKVEADAKADRESKEHEIQVKRAQSREIKDLLAFFFSSGYVQPGRIQTAEKRPISFSKLRAAGALESSIEGHTAMLSVLNDLRDKDRPAWRYGTTVSTLSSSERDKLKKIQDTLNELGPILVELKMLDP